MYIANTTNQHVGQQVSRDIVGLYVELAETSGGFFHNTPEQGLTFDPFHFVNAVPDDGDPADLDFDLIRQGSAVAILCRLYDHWCDAENFDDSWPWILHLTAALDAGAFAFVPDTEAAIRDILIRSPDFHDQPTAQHFERLYNLYVRDYFNRLVNNSVKPSQSTPPPLVGYVIVRHDVQIGRLDWEQGDLSSFIRSLKHFMEDNADEDYDEYDLVTLGIDLYSLKYAVLETSFLEMKFIRRLLPEE